MPDPKHPVSAEIAGRKPNVLRPRLLLVRHTPRILCRRDGEAKLERVEAYLLRQLRAAKRLGLPAYVRHYSIGFHSLLLHRIMRRKGVRP